MTVLNKDSVSEFRRRLSYALDRGELFPKESNSTTVDSTLMGTGVEPSLEEDWGSSMNDTAPLLPSDIDDNDSNSFSDEFIIQSIILSHAEAWLEDGHIVSMENIFTVAYLLGYREVTVSLETAFSHSIKELV